MRSIDHWCNSVTRDRQVLTGGLVLVVGILLVFARTQNFAFLNFDDYFFILHNPNVATELTGDNLVWAWQTGY